MKRFLTLALSVLLAATSLMMPSSAVPAWNGDANGDGTIDIKDATAIVKSLASWNIELDPLADFDQNGRVNITDVMMILRHLAGYNVAPDSLLEAMYGVSEVSFEIPEPTPTETVYGSQFGFNTESEDNSQAFYDAVAYLKEHPGTTLEIEKGTYKMAPPAPVTLSGVENCVIDGGGSTFLYSKGNYFTVTDNSNLVMIKNLTVDWDWEKGYLIESIVRVRDIQRTEETGTVRVEFEILNADDATHVLTSPWDNLLPLDPERLTIGVYGYGDQFTASTAYTDKAVSEEDKTVFSAKVDSSLAPKAGTVWMLRHYNYNAAVFYTLGGAHNITYRDINIYSTHSCGIIVRNPTTHHIRIDGVNITLNPEKLDVSRLSTSADAINIADSGGYFIIENCEIAYQGDDGVNIHDNVGIVTNIGDDFVTVKASNQDNYREGTTVRFKNGQDYSDYDFTLNVVSREALGDATYKITFDEEVPLDIIEGDVIIDCVNNSSNYIIRNNYFHENRGRALLLNSSNGLVEGNRFYRTQAQAINMTVEVWDHSWQEGTGIDNLIIRNNVFDEVNVEGREAAVTFIANSTQTKDGKIHGECFKNILIANNTFINTNKQAILARSASNLTIIGNTFKNPDDITHPYGDEIALPFRGMVELTAQAFKNVTIAHNTWEASPYIPENVVKYHSKVKKEVNAFSNNVVEALPE